MAEKLKLKPIGNRLRLRMHLAVLLVIVLASLSIGYVLGQNGIVAGMAVKENCIPQKDFQFFVDKANVVQEEYQKCVSDLWSLQLAYKMNTAKTNSILNSTK